MTKTDRQKSRSNNPDPQDIRGVCESGRDIENWVDEEAFHEGQEMNEDRTRNIVSKDLDPHTEVTSSVYLYTMCAALNSFNFGYDMGVCTDASLSL